MKCIMQYLNSFFVIGSMFRQHSRGSCATLWFVFAWTSFCFTTTAFIAELACFLARATVRPLVHGLAFAQLGMKLIKNRYVRVCNPKNQLLQIDSPTIVGCSW